jgi:hypothetical protein
VIEAANNNRHGHRDATMILVSSCLITSLFSSSRSTHSNALASMIELFPIGDWFATQSSMEWPSLFIGSLMARLRISLKLMRLPAWPTCRRGLQTRNAKLDPDQGAGIARFALVRRLRPAGWEACQARLETGLRAGAELNGAEETDGREQ